MCEPVTMAMMSKISMGLSAVSTVMGAVQASKAGKAAQQAANARAKALEHQAAQARQIAGQERASAQRAAYNEKRKGQIISSRALAVAAAGGGGAGDPTVENILGDIGAEGEFRALSALFTGESRAVDLETQADLKIFEGSQERYAGRVAKQAGTMSAVTKVASGFGKIGMSAYDRFGGATGGVTPPTTSLSSGSVIGGNSSYSSFNRSYG